MTRKSKLVKCYQCDNKFWQIPPIPNKPLCIQCSKTCSQCSSPLEGDGYEVSSLSGPHRTYLVCNECYDRRSSHDTLEGFWNRRNPSDMWLDKQRDAVFSLKERFSNLLLESSVSPKNILILKNSFEKADLLIRRASIEMSPWRRDELMTDLSILLDKIDAALAKFNA